MKIYETFVACALGCATLAPFVTPIACTPAQEAVWAQVESTVLADLTSQQTLAFIEAAVAALVPDGTDVDLVITDAITFLHDTGALPPNVFPTSYILGLQTAIASKTHFVKGAP